MEIVGKPINMVMFQSCVNVYQGLNLNHGGLKKNAGVAIQKAKKRTSLCVYIYIYIHIYTHYVEALCTITMSVFSMNSDAHRLFFTPLAMFSSQMGRTKMIPEATELATPKIETQ